MFRTLLLDREPLLGRRGALHALVRPLALVLLAGALTGCPDSDSPAGIEREPQLRVTFDLSRGDDNPSFTLSRGESHVFRKKFEDLEEQKGKVAPQPGKTGYQGVVVREVGRGDGRPEYRLKNGWLVVTNRGVTKGYADKQRALESWVAKRGERVVPAAPYEEVQRELASQ
ncbi:MAG: hypothetical protein IPF92_01000 [Myxococcales bacterium]|jgi:hypothetical protein|nr:hypothetical protein [Myxococcales bacterium]MBL0193708.1 hypothetical protein [Myxococcales bacterium]HQY61034.1 hypothetical protein [Polyangiaceae bacterium]